MRSRQNTIVWFADGEVAATFAKSCSVMLAKAEDVTQALPL